MGRAFRGRASILRRGGLKAADSTRASCAQENDGDGDDGQGAGEGNTRRKTSQHWRKGSPLQLGCPVSLAQRRAVRYSSDTRVPSQHREHRPKGVPSVTARTRVPSQISAWLVMCLSCWGRGVGVFDTCGHGSVLGTGRGCRSTSPSTPACNACPFCARVASVRYGMTRRSSIARRVFGEKGFIRSLSPRLDLRDARYYSVRPTQNPRW